MNYRDWNVTIGGIVAELPQASHIFREFGIDFCCGGHRILRTVMQEQGINEEVVYEALELAQKERGDSYRDQDFQSMTQKVLTTYIEDTHHSYLRRELPEIADLLGTILRVHGANHAELFEVYRIFGMLKVDLEQHLLKEETLLFPSMAVDEINRQKISDLANDIIGEHEAAGELLSQLRLKTNNYTIPKDGCSTYRKTYDKLEELEQDLHQHIHLENNILLKEYDVRKE